MNTKNRLEHLRSILIEKKVGALWISQPDNLFYLSGCEGLEGYLLITAEKAVIATDFRYIEQAQRQSPDFTIFQISGKMADWLPQLMSGEHVQTLGFESNHLAFATYQQWAQTLKNTNLQITPVETSGLIDSLRMVKDAVEIVNITQAVQITDKVFAYIEEVLRPGMTERALAWEIEKYLRQNGSQPVPFELIVAAGPNSALPHARPSDYSIHTGEPIVIDIGAKVNHYASDLTRTLFIGRPDDTFKKVYQTVLEAQEAAISGIRSGMTGIEADSLARGVISRKGYGDAFGHSLGHGIGLVTHEKPTVGPGSTDVLNEGMVFTVEPGIYLSGWGGVRIEDDVIIENGKSRVISHAPKLNYA